MTLPSIPCYLGAVNGLSGDVLHGWAMSSAEPQLRLAVEIYIDHVFVALVRADMEQPQDAPGDGFHGFALQIRPAWLENASHISARIANQGPWLGNGIALPQTRPCAPNPSATQGWSNGGLKIRGWAWDPSEPSRHVTITAREGSKQLLKTVANRQHYSLIDRPTSDHGFDLDLPWQLADGKPHEIHLETDTGESLTGSPFQICVHAEGFAALLSQHAGSGESRPNIIPLLTQLAQTQDIHFPRSAGFQHYAHWHASFQQPAPYQATSARALVLLYGAEDANAESTSRASISQQRLPAAQIAISILQVDTSLADLLASLHGIDVVVPLQRGDRLAAHALDCMSQCLQSQAADWCYADCDQDDEQGKRSNPWFKPAWDETLFYGVDIVTPGAVISATALKRAITLLQQEGAQHADWHRLLAAVLVTSNTPVAHLPHVLYHRHCTAPKQPQQALPDSRRQHALHWLAQKRAKGASIESVSGFPALNRVRWPLPESRPLISLVVPTRDQYKLLSTCINGLLEQTDYPTLEILIVDNDSCDPQTLDYLNDIQQRGVRVLRYPHAFNYSAINNWAVEHASGEFIGLVNNDIEVTEAGWLDEMLSQLLRPGVGAVGAKLMWPNGMVQHGGVIVGINGLAAHVGNDLLQSDPGYLGFNQIAREHSVVTTACLLMRKRDYQRLGGMDEVRFPVTFNDVDLCMRLGETGKRLVWTPFAQLIHAESASRGKEDTPTKAARAQREYRHFIQRWSAEGQLDPCYHPCLSADYLSGPFGGLALPPRSTAPRCRRPYQKNDI